MEHYQFYWIKLLLMLLLVEYPSDSKVWPRHLFCRCLEQAVITDFVKHLLRVKVTTKVQFFVMELVVVSSRIFCFTT